MLTSCLMLSETYYAQNHAGIIGLGPVAFMMYFNSSKAMPSNNNNNSYD